MLPECLKDWIGVKCLTTSKSGYNINDLEGLNLRYAADIADSNYVSGLQFLKEKIDFATALVLNEISKYAENYYRVNSLVDQLKVGEWKNTFTLPANLDRGIRVRAHRSRMLRIRVNSVEIRIQEANHTDTLTIKDGIFTETYSFTTDSTGAAYVQANYLSKTNEIFITINNQNINVNNTDVKQGCGCQSKQSNYLVANGWNGSNISNTTYGIVADTVAECDQNELYCILSSKLTFPILYRSGLEVAKEAATTDRLNTITLLDDDKVEYLLKNFINEYDKHMKILIDSIPDLMKRVDDCCIICNQSRYVFGKP
jgi:hypothetical protein